MFGHNRNSGIHWMRNYGDALHKYQNTTDIRGRVEEPKRPLGLRRSVDMYSIRKRDDGAIECVCYKTPVVTFYPDETIEIRNEEWNTVSTAYFIEEVTGFRARVFNNSLCVSVGGIETRLETMLKVKDGQFVGIKADTTHYIKRAEANKVRKQYADFLTYACALVRLKAEGFTNDEMAETFGKNKHGNLLMPDSIARTYWADFGKHVREVFALVNDTTEDRHIAYYKAVLVIANCFGTNTYSNNYTNRGVHIKEDAFKRAFNNLMLGYHRDEVFGIKDRELGEVKRDPYVKYFSGGWKRMHASENLT